MINSSPSLIRALIVLPIEVRLHQPSDRHLLGGGSPIPHRWRCPQGVVLLLSDVKRLPTGIETVQRASGRKGPLCPAAEERACPITARDTGPNTDASMTPEISTGSGRCGVSNGPLILGNMLGFANGRWRRPAACAGGGDGIGRTSFPDLDAHRGAGERHLCLRVSIRTLLKGHEERHDLSPNAAKGDQTLVTRVRRVQDRLGPSGPWPPTYWSGWTTPQCHAHVSHHADCPCLRGSGCIQTVPGLRVHHGPLGQCSQMLGMYRRCPCPAVQEGVRRSRFLSKSLRTRDRPASRFFRCWLAPHIVMIATNASTSDSAPSITALAPAPIVSLNGREGADSTVSGLTISTEAGPHMRAALALMSYTP
jgi:hypothetical protein